MNIISLKERRRKLRKEMESLRSPAEKDMSRQIELLVETIDDLRDRVETLEARQLQLVRALNELLRRVETDDD
jgi:chromosome segregation ATPase